MNMKTVLAALQGVTAYKDILTLPVMERALRLTACTVHGDGLGGLEAYTDLFYRLRQEGCAGLGGWLGNALRWSEGPYPRMAERGDRDPALEQAARLDISAFEVLASVDCDKWLAQLGRLLDSDTRGLSPPCPGGGEACPSLLTSSPRPTKGKARGNLPVIGPSCGTAGS